MHKTIAVIVGGSMILAALGLAADGDKPSPASQGTSKVMTLGKPKAGGSNLDFWLNQADPNGKAGAPDPASKPSTDNPFRRKDALPGVIEFSDGKLLAGYLYTTLEKNWEVFTEQDKRWHLVPFVTLLSINAVVVEANMEQKWRWKEMGVPERVYTGEAYPFRRLTWNVHCIDDSTMGGTIKGQPLWIEAGGKKVGPFIMAERLKGEIGQKVEDLVYIKRIIVSKRLADEVIEDQMKNPPTLPKTK